MVILYLVLYNCVCGFCFVLFCFKCRIATKDSRVQSSRLAGVTQASSVPVSEQCEALAHPHPVWKYRTELILLKLMYFYLLLIKIFVCG